MNIDDESVTTLRTSGAIWRIGTSGHQAAKLGRTDDREADLSLSTATATSFGRTC